MDVVEYGILGPLSVQTEGRPLNLGGPRQRMVLAILLSRANQTVPQGELIDAVWLGEPPDTGKATLHGYIYALRQQLGRDAIVRRAEGYRVDVVESSLDALRFRKLVDERRAVLADDPAMAATLLKQALDLWHGLPFGDLGSNPILAGDVSSLMELRLVAVESRLEAELALDNHAASVGELDSLTHEYPLRERFWGQYVLALYRSGRQGDALRADQRARTHLAEELGIDPSPDLQVLEQRILEQDPTLMSSRGPESHAAAGVKGVCAASNSGRSSAEESSARFIEHSNPRLVGKW